MLGILSVIVLAYPFLTIGHLFFPITVFGKNAYVAAPLFISLSSLILISRRGIPKELVSLTILTIAASLIYLARGLIFSEQQNVLDVRYVVSGPIFLILFYELLRDSAARNLLAGAAVTTTIIESLIGILHTHYFSYINIDLSQDAPELAFDFLRTREGGTLGASIYANFILCGLFLLAFYRHQEVWYQRNFILRATISVMMIYAISLSGSRYPITISLIVGAVLLVDGLRNNRKSMAALAITGLIGAIVFLYGNVQLYHIFRFDEDSGSRVDKLLLGVRLIFDAPLNVVIGPSIDKIIAAVTPDGIGISDNSYVQLSLQFGFPFAFLWFWFLIQRVTSNVHGAATRFLAAYFVVGLGMTNCILWEPWLFLFLLVFSLVSLNQPAEPHISHLEYRT